MWTAIASISVSGQLSTYPSPNPTLTLNCYQLTVVELGKAGHCDSATAVLLWICHMILENNQHTFFFQTVFKPLSKFLTTVKSQIQFHCLSLFIQLTSPGLIVSTPPSSMYLCWLISCLFVWICLLRLTISTSKGRTWLSPRVPDTDTRYSCDRTIP